MSDYKLTDVEEVNKNGVEVPFDLEALKFQINELTKGKLTKYSVATAFKSGNLKVYYQGLPDSVTLEMSNFISGDVLNIYKILEVVRRLVKGSANLFLKKILDLDCDYHKTVTRCSINDLRNFVKWLKKFKLDISKFSFGLERKYKRSRFVNTDKVVFESQSWFSSIANFNKLVEQDVPKIIGGVEKVTSVLDKDLPALVKTCEHINSFAGNFSNFVDKLKPMLSNFVASVDFAALLNKMYLVCAHLYYKSSIDLLVSSIFNLMSGIVPSSKISEFLKTYFNFSPNRASEGSLNIEPQSFEFDGFLPSLITAIVDTLKYAMGGLSKEEFLKYTVKVKKVAVLSTFLKSCTSVFDYSIAIIDFVLQYVVKYVTKRVNFMPKSLVPDGLREIYEELDFIEKNDIVEKSLISSAAARTVIMFRDKVNVFLNSGNDKEINKLMMMHINFIKREVEQWYKCIPPYLKDVPGSDRQKPVWIYIYGKPRIGKTTIVAKSIVYSCAHTMKLVSDVDKWDAFVFNRNLGDPYWEGYNGHPVVSYTDILQEIKDEQKLDLAITELTRVNDGNAYMLPMAFDGPKGKGKNYFTSRLLVSDAQGDMNIGPFTDRCWSKGVHIMARRTLVLEILLNEKYSSTVGVDLVKLHKAYSEGNFVGTLEYPVCPTDMYTFRFRNSVNSEIIEKEISDFKTAMLWISTFSAQASNTELDHSIGVQNFCKTLFAQSEELCFEDCDSGGFDKPCEKWCWVKDQTQMLSWSAVFRKVKHKCATTCEQYYEYMQSLPNKLRYAAIRCDLAGFISGLDHFIWCVWENYKRFYADNAVYMGIFALSYISGICFSVLIKAGVEKLLYKNEATTVVAQTHESRERKSVVVRQRVKNVKRNAADLNSQSYSAHARDSLLTIKNSMCRVVLRTLDDKQVLAAESGLCIGGDVFVFPKHFWKRVYTFREKCVNSILELNWPSRANNLVTEIHLDRVKEYPVDEAWQHSADLIFVQIVNIVCGKNLAKKFVSIKDNPNMALAKLVGIRALTHRCKPNCVCWFETDSFKLEILPVTSTQLCSTNSKYAPDEIVDEPLVYSDSSSSVLSEYVATTTTVVSQYYKYSDCTTNAGDCGMLLVHDDVVYPSKILGMHVAGAVKEQIGISCPIFSEDINDVLAWFKTITKNEFDDVVIPTMPLVGLGSQALELGLAGEGRLGTFERNGKQVSYKVPLPSKTKISKSLVYDWMAEDFGVSKVKPAALVKFIDFEGNCVSPILKGLDKLLQSTNMFSFRDSKLIAQHMCESMVCWRSNLGNIDFRVLTLGEALNGIPGMKQVEFKTSAGFPFVKLAVVSNKIPWLDICENLDKSKILKPNKLLMEFINKREQAALEGLIVPTYFVDTLKDETRDIDKVNQGKTRVFQVGPFDLTVLLRKYFGCFMSFCHTTYISGEIGIGVNPDSVDWHFLIKRLLLSGNKFLCGDYSNYDASINLSLCEIIYDVIQSFYCDDYGVVRKTLLLTVFSSTHIVDNLVYSFRQGNPSGDALTSIINCLANMALMRWCYIKLVSPDLYRYNVHVSASYYGDDSLMVVSDEVVSKYNMNTVSNELLKLGFKYTSAMKGEVSQDYLSIDEASYLCRNVKFNDILGVYTAPIYLSVLTEVARWSQSDPFNEVDQLARFNQTLLFASLHGERLFLSYREKFKEYMDLLNKGYASVDDQVVKTSFDPTLLFTFTRCLDIIYPERVLKGYDLHF